MSAYRGKSIKNKSKLRNEAKFIKKFNQIIANQTKEELNKSKEYE